MTRALNTSTRKKLEAAATQLSEIQDTVAEIAQAERNKACKADLKSIESKIETVVDDIQGVVQ